MERDELTHLDVVLVVKDFGTEVGLNEDVT